MSNVESLISWLNFQLYETSNYIKELQSLDNIADNERAQEELEKLYFRRVWIETQLDNLYSQKK